MRYGARVDDALFEDLFRRRAEGEKVRVPKALEVQFEVDDTPSASRIRGWIERHARRREEDIERDLLSQMKRLADAEGKLAGRPTRTALNEREVAERRIERLRNQRDRLRSGALSDLDSRIYAFDWAPVLIRREGERWIVPMRYHLRPSGMPENFDRKYPGCYNARRDSLTGFWRRQFGRNHAVLILASFFENVKLHDYERRGLDPGEAERNRVVQFFPRGHEVMEVPCIWDHWVSRSGLPSSSGAPGSVLESFALITDEPPPEVAATGHGRCPIFLRERNLDGWLDPAGRSDERLFSLLDDRERPYYEHSLTG